MRLTDLEKIIEQAKRDARLTDLTDLDLSHSYMTRLPDSIIDLLCLKNLRSVFTPISSLPENIGNLSSLETLSVRFNKLTILPESICNLKKLTKLDLSCSPKLNSLPDNIGNLSSLIELNLGGCFGQLTRLPNSIGNLSELKILNLSENQLTALPDSICNLSRLKTLDLSKNQLTDLPKNIGCLSRLSDLDLSLNQIKNLPESIDSLSALTWLNLNGNKLSELPISLLKLNQLEALSLCDNPLTDLSILNKLDKLQYVWFFNIELPRRYWTKFSDWKSEWLLDEHNAEIRRVLIEQVGYEKICEDLGAIMSDSWREYTLLKIDNFEKIYYEDGYPAGIDPMLLLKMNCPSTGHIHILRVPPEMTSAEAAITWVNHGIHPDEFSVQT
jgi:leucine-rich repeat protein SHOC2